jgi:hypothetical protein
MVVGKETLKGVGEIVTDPAFAQGMAYAADRLAEEAQDAARIQRENQEYANRMIEEGYRRQAQEEQMKKEQEQTARTRQQQEASDRLKAQQAAHSIQQQALERQRQEETARQKALQPAASPRVREIPVTINIPPAQVAYNDGSGRTSGGSTPATKIAANDSSWNNRSTGNNSGNSSGVTGSVKQDSYESSKIRKCPERFSTLPLKLSDDTAVVITWKTQRGYWNAAGPVQCLSLAEETEEKAMEYVYNEKDSPGYVGEIGKYKIYSLGRELTGGDDDPRCCIRE